MVGGFGIGAIAFVLLAVITVLAGAKVVPQGSAWTVERFGRYTKTLKPGLNIIVPYIDRIGHKVSMMETVLDIIPQDVISSDNAMVTTDAVCFYQVQYAEKAAYEVNDRDRVRGAGTGGASLAGPGAVLGLAATGVRGAFGRDDDRLSQLFQTG